MAIGFAGWEAWICWAAVKVGSNLGRGWLSMPVRFVAPLAAWHPAAYPVNNHHYVLYTVLKRKSKLMERVREFTGSEQVIIFNYGPEQSLVEESNERLDRLETFQLPTNLDSHI